MNNKALKEYSNIFKFILWIYHCLNEKKKKRENPCKLCEADSK